MDTSVELGKRVSVLENSMSWAQGSIGKIERDLDTLKNGQIQLSEQIADVRAHTNERISGLQAHMDEKFIGFHREMASFQAHTDEKFAGIHKEFAGVHKEFSGVHKEIANIHRAISIQTKWILAVILGASVLISIMQPLMLKLI